MPYRAIIIEDDLILAETMSEWLSQHDFKCDLVGRGDESFAWFNQFQYDLAIVDWQLPGCSGIEIIKKYREMKGAASVLMLTSKNQIEEKEKGLDAGADDYLTKPFDFLELGARIRALMRRPASYVTETIKRGSITLNMNERSLKKDGFEIALTPNEFAILQFFLRHPADIVNNEALIARIWDSDSDVTADAIYSTIKRLRKKLGAEIIENVRGLGYKLGTVE